MNLSSVGPPNPLLSRLPRVSLSTPTNARSFDSNSGATAAVTDQVPDSGLRLPEQDSGRPPSISYFEKLPVPVPRYSPKNSNPISVRSPRNSSLQDKRKSTNVVVVAPVEREGSSCRSDVAENNALTFDDPNINNNNANGSSGRLKPKLSFTLDADPSPKETMTAGGGGVGSAASSPLADASPTLLPSLEPSYQISLGASLLRVTPFVVVLLTVFSMLIVLMVEEAFVPDLRADVPPSTALPLEELLNEWTSAAPDLGCIPTLILDSRYQIMRECSNAAVWDLGNRLGALVDRMSLEFTQKNIQRAFPKITLNFPFSVVNDSRHNVEAYFLEVYVNDTSCLKHCVASKLKMSGVVNPACFYQIRELELENSFGSSCSRSTSSSSSNSSTNGVLENCHSAPITVLSMFQAMNVSTEMISIANNREVRFSLQPPSSGATTMIRFAEPAALRIKVEVWTSLSSAVPMGNTRPQPSSQLTWMILTSLCFSIFVIALCKFTMVLLRRTTTALVQTCNAMSEAFTAMSTLEKISPSIRWGMPRLCCDRRRWITFAVSGRNFFVQLRREVITASFQLEKFRSFLPKASAATLESEGAAFQASDAAASGGQLQFQTSLSLASPKGRQFSLAPGFEFGRMSLAAANMLSEHVNLQEYDASAPQGGGFFNAILSRRHESISAGGVRDSLNPFGNSFSNTRAFVSQGEVGREASMSGMVQSPDLCSHSNQSSQSQQPLEWVKSDSANMDPTRRSMHVAFAGSPQNKSLTLGSPRNFSVAPQALLDTAFQEVLTDSRFYKFTKRATFLVCTLHFVVSPYCDGSISVQRQKQSNAFIAFVAQIVEDFQGVVVHMSPFSFTASWNAFQPFPFHEARGALCALHIASQFPYFENSPFVRFENDVRWSICVNTGAVVVGFCGNSSVVKPTVVGEALTVCERVASLSPLIHCPILVLEACYAVARDAVFCIPVDVVAYGQCHIVVFELKSKLEDAAPDLYQPIMEAFYNLTLHEFDSVLAVLQDAHEEFDSNVIRFKKLAQLFLSVEKVQEHLVPNPYSRDYPCWDFHEVEAEKMELTEDLLELLEQTRAMSLFNRVQIRRATRNPSILPENYLRDEITRMFVDDNLSEVSKSSSRDQCSSAQRLEKQSSTVGLPTDPSFVNGSEVLISKPTDPTSLFSEVLDRKGVLWRRGEKRLGSGSFGEVYVGLGENGQLVALKLIPLPKSRVLSAVIEDVLSEVSLLAQLKNDNIVRYFSSAVCKSHFVIVMEYMDGGSLTRLLNIFGALKTPAIRRFCRDILSGLKFLHEKGLVHRDINTNNILLTIDGICKISDFGTSKSLSTITTSLDVIGTPAFMAPEACRGNATTASDIWSFGILMCQLYSGELPYPQTLVNSPQELIRLIGGLAEQKGQQRLLGSIEPPIATPQHIEPTIPTEFIDDERALSLIRSCLSWDEKKRPGAHQMLMHPFFTQ